MHKSNCGSFILCAFTSKCLYVMVMLLSTIPLVLADDTRADKILVRTWENASNPLSIVNYTDVRYHYHTSDIEDENRLFIEGTLVATSRLKIIYDLSYSQTDRSGEDEADFETLGISPVYLVSMAN